MTRLGSILHARRTQRGLTQAQVASVAGISAVYVCQLERGERLPESETIKGLARALDLDPPLLLRMAIEARYPDSAALFMETSPCPTCAEYRARLDEIAGLAGGVPSVTPG